VEGGKSHATDQFIAQQERVGHRDTSQRNSQQGTHSGHQAGDRCLAKQLGVSPIPVREALQQLEADGYVVIEPYLGARVAPIEAESVIEVFSLLETMEVVSSRAACQQMSDADFSVLEKFLLKMDSLISEPELWSRENRYFHRFICDKSGTRLVGSLMSKVLDHWDRLHRYFLKDVFARRLRHAQREHWELLRTLRSRDPARTEAVVREHARSAISAYQKHLAHSDKPWKSTSLKSSV
jgi:DNA-binding GntR family transcriptional regulator